MSRCWASVCALAVAVAGFSAKGAFAQTAQWVARSTDALGSVNCAPGAGQSQERKHRSVLRSFSTLSLGENCRTPQEPLPDRRVRETSSAFGDPVEAELRSMGVAGQTIIGVREEVLEILRAANACSAWYAQAEREPAAKFASLRFRVDSGGGGKVQQGKGAAGIHYREPYVARAQQNVAPGSVITLNANGPFFQSIALIDLKAEYGPAPHQLFRRLIVGDHPGGSLKAQVTTLLHEYAHVVDLVPVDAGEPELSTQNTQTVLSHCHKEIEASPARTIVLRY